MSRNLDSIGREFRLLTENDFDLRNPEARGLERIATLCDELIAFPTDCVAPLILEFIERFADPKTIDAAFDLGMPGPLVHALERLEGYEPFLVGSVARRPLRFPFGW